MKSPLLIVDDDVSVLGLLSAHLHTLGYCIRCEENAIGLRNALQVEEFQTVLLDLQLPDGDGIALLEEIQKIDPDLPVIIITAHGSIERAVDAMRKGAYDFCPKPIDFNRLDVSVKNAVECYTLKKKVTTWERAHRTRLCDLIGGSPDMQVVYHIIETVAPTKAPVLITGESGTGKELAARAIHRLSPRGERELIDVNCAAIPKDLLESELFGHERFAFTGANERSIGRCERADGSTLFLDEISEMEPTLQAKLLRFLQERAFYRVGGKEKIIVDARIISATNCDPIEAIETNRFREDLYYRLNVVHLPMPPLRNHPDDIPELAEQFLKIYSDENQKRFRSISTEAMEFLLRHPWPGNVRELENCIQQAVVLYDAEQLETAMLPEIIRTAESVTVPHSPIIPENETAEKPSDRIAPFEEVEKQAIEQALKVTQGNVAQAAAGLHLSQATLYRKIRDYNLILESFKNSRPF